MKCLFLTDIQAQVPLILCNLFASGDVRYKPFVSGDPEIKQFPLDGTEDFLVIATDGLTDYVGPTQILSVLYHEMHRNPSE